MRGESMHTIAFLNQKGGVGKTSTCYHLSGTYSQAGRPILLIDADPQSSLTQGFFGPSVSRGLARGNTIAALFAGDRPFPEEVIRETGIPGVDILPGSRHATDFNIPRPWDAPADQQTCLRDFLSEIEDRYSMVLIDCPPNLYLCSWAALVASASVVVPLTPEDFGAQGLIDVQESVARVRGAVNAGVRILGFLPTMVNARLAVHQQYIAMLGTIYGDAVFSGAMPISPDFKESLTGRKPVAFYKPRGTRVQGDEGDRGQRIDEACPGQRGRADGRGSGMSKREHLQSLAGNIAESMGVGVPQRSPAVTSPAPSSSRKLEGIARSRNVAEITHDRINPDPDQPRQEFDDAALARLAESLKSSGQLQPIRVRWDDARGAYVVIVGERRWRAAQLAGLPTLMAVIHDGTPGVGDLLSWQLVENALREDLGPVDQARAYRRLMDLNRWTGAELARQLSIDPGSVTRALSLLDLPGAIRELVENDKLSPRTAYEVAKLSDPEDQIRLAGRIVSERMTRDEAAAAVRERPTKTDRAARWRRERLDFGKLGNVVVTVPADAANSAVVTILRRAIKRLLSGDEAIGDKVA